MLQDNQQKLGEKEKVNGKISDYSEMKEIQNNLQSDSVRSSVQDLASWGKDDHEKGEGSGPKHTGGAC